MRVASKIVTSLGSLAILGLGWLAGTAGTTTATSTSATSASGTTSVGSNGSGSSSGTGPGITSGSSPGVTGSTGTGATNSSSTSGATATGSRGKDGSYTGSDISTRFGDVQVEVVVRGGQITDVVALHLTDSERRSVQISARAEPTLKSEVLASQSAKITSVSGATYTSDAYVQSLQSALDQAGY